MDNKNNLSTFNQIFKKEWHEQTVKNKKRIIKFIAICIVPFLYGFFCVWAFWKPFLKTNQIPMAIVNHDASLCVIYKPKDDKDQSIANGTDVHYVNMNDEASCRAATTPSDEIARFTSVSDNVVTGSNYYDKEHNDVKINVSTVNLKLAYLKNQATNFNPVDKYWVQLRIPENYSVHLINILKNIANSTFDDNQFLTDVTWMSNNPINLWATYKKNFLIGYFATTFTNLRESFVREAVPQLILPMLYTILSNPDGTVTRATYNEYVKSINTGNLINETNKLVTQGKLTAGQGKIINSLLRVFGIVKDKFAPFIFNSKDILNKDEYFANSNELGRHLKDIGNIIDIPYNVQGYENNKYGIGLGELFMLIGVWVGALTQTFVYDRKGRTKQTLSYQHYFSKLLLMLCTSWIQVTVMMVALLILGFGQIGPAYALLWLWMLFLGSLFNIIICSIWLAIPYEMVGRFIVVVYLIINLSSGWGTFPSFMQNKFFDILSYVAPFRYGLHNIGTIIYGLSSPTSIGIGQYQTEIVKNMGILFIWVIIFVTIGVVATYYRFLKMKYGTTRIKLIFQAMNNIDNIKKYDKNINTLNQLTLEEQILVKAEVLGQVSANKIKKKIKQ
ncbi:ABC transporter [Spiroplasma endosymbiont of Stenodema calcarata]|uniref:ABC transporter n=1 Tax=Spiroplasma endosymbiont of Stenodema calcarata TaxID=3139328 RepID=UPI003CCA8EDC